VSTRASRRHPILVILVALAVLSTPALLFAHAHLLRSNPLNGETLTGPPRRLALWFSEKPELAFTSITLADTAGKTFAVGKAAAIDSMGVMVDVTDSVPPGKYQVAWKTAAADGHATSGSFFFTVAAPANQGAAAADTGQVPVIRVDTVITHRVIANSLVVPQQVTVFSTAMHWAELVALLGMIGFAIFRLAILPASEWPSDLTRIASDRALRLSRGLLVLFAVTTATRGFAQADLMPGFIGSRFAALATLVQSTHWGFAWAIGAVGTAVVFLGLIVAGRSMSGWVTAAIGLIAICVSEALTGHSAAVSRAALAVAADVAHVLGAGGWLGGLLAVVLCGMPAAATLNVAAANERGSRLIRSYHRTATECVTIVVISALVAAWTRFPSLPSLWTTPYGWALIRKTIAVAVIVGLGIYHWRRVVIPDWTTDVRARFRRTAVAELFFGAIVLALTAVLLTRPLP